MPGEKKKVSDEIVRVIESRVGDYIQQVDHGQSEQLEEAMVQYQKSVEQFYSEKFSRLKDKQTGLEHKEISALRFEMNSELKRYRNELLETFKESLIEDLKAFVANEKDYQVYLNACLSKLEPGGVVYVRKEDLDLIQGYETQVRDLKIGGLIYELENRVYDFSLTARFEDAIQQFIKTSKIWIRSDEN